MIKTKKLPDLPMKPQEVADAYNLSYQTILEEIKNGRLNARHKKGETRTWYITKNDIEQWIQHGMWD